MLILFSSPPGRLQPLIPKLNPPPPTLKRRSSKTTSPSLEAETPSSTVANPSSALALTRVAFFSLSDLELEARTLGGRVGSHAEKRGHLGLEPAREGRHLLLAKGIPDQGPSRNGVSSALDGRQSFSSAANETHLHISLSEDELDKVGTCMARA